MKPILLATAFILLFAGGAFSQNINFQYVSEHEYTWTYSCYEALFDDQDRPYIYTANNELGFMVYDISDINNPMPIDTFMPTTFGGLKVTNISQEGNYIYASLGGFQGIAQRAGMAIFNISDPTNVTVEDSWDSTAFNQGGAIAIVDGDYAYLGGMEKGVIVLDVSDKSNIQYVSDYYPDPNWPHTPGLFSTPNARGMAIKGNELYLCYDAGALRVIDITDKQTLNEIGHYINIELDTTAQPAYNNVVIVDNYAYIAVDYCGIDIVDISSPANPVNAGWVNPWDCNVTNWDGRPGHTNKVLTWANDNILFVSGADTEILAYDISDRENPVEIGSYFAILDSNVTWSVDVKDGYAVMAQVDNPLGVPYDSDWGGIRILQWDGGPTGIEASEGQQLVVYPNPIDDRAIIKLNQSLSGNGEIRIYDTMGRLCKVDRITGNSYELRKEHYSPGMYFFEVVIEDASLGRGSFISN